MFAWQYMQQMRRSLDTNKAGINSIYLPSSFIVVTNEEIWYTFRIFAWVHKFRGEFVAVAKVFRTPAPLPARLSSLLSSSLKPRVTTTVIPVALAAALCYLVGHPRRRDGVQVWALSVIWKEAEKKRFKIMTIHWRRTELGDKEKVGSSMKNVCQTSTQKKIWLVTSVLSCVSQKPRNDLGHNNSLKTKPFLSMKLYYTFNISYLKNILK